MIESLSLKNFYCFNDTETISFVASKERNRIQDQQYSGFATMNRVNILKLAYLIGNNGAGKSKTFQGFWYLKYLVTKIRAKKEDILKWPKFQFDEQCDNIPSELTLVYHIEDKRYRYHIAWTSSAITNEDLTELRPRSEQVLFVRTFDNNTKETIVDFMPAMNMTDDQQYLIKSAILNNNSIISIVSNTNLSHPILNELALFFNDGFEIVDLDRVDLNESMPGDGTSEEAKLKKLITNILQGSGTNIVAYEKLTVVPYYPKDLINEIHNWSKERQAALKEIIGMERERHVVNTFHRIKGQNGKRTRLPISQQSKGTKELISLILVLNEAIQKKKTIILDDFNTFVQRKTWNMLLNFFLSCNRNAQILFSTQDYSLLDYDYARRDSIRFLIKDDYGASHFRAIQLRSFSKNTNLLHYLYTNNFYGQLPIIQDEKLKDAIDQYLLDLD